MQTVSRTELALLTLASAVVTANAYYIHPIIARVAEDFGVSAAAAGMVPALNQLALALGIFLLLPLGDRFSNRKLIVIFVIGQCVGITGMAFAPSFNLFIASSTLLGFFTIAPYLLPAYVSRRASPQQLGQVTATLTTGIVMGILLARAGAGVIGEHLGWRTVYYLAAAMMVSMVFILPAVMVENEQTPSDEETFSYIRLLGSLRGIINNNTEILFSGVIQGSSFGIFLATWLGLGLHLTSPAMGYGVDVVGYLALIAIANLFVTPRVGKLADTVGARRARFWLALIQSAAALLLLLFGHSLWLLILPLMLMNLVGPSIDVTSRMLFLSKAPELRTRLTTVYIILMFVGGGLGSWLGTAAYEWGGWNATAILVIGFSGVIVLLSYLTLQRYEPPLK
ncbi:MAG: MFS transporter [Halioglobus sp.]